jgi:AbrB family looped-hinge helix DNA binding protein
MTTTISSKGQIVLPAEIRERAGFKPGQQFVIERLDRGDYRLKRKARAPNQGLIKLLFDCPAKNWFKPADRRQTTDDIEPPRLG